MCFIFVALARSAGFAVGVLSSQIPCRCTSVSCLEEGHLPPQLGHLTALKDLALSCAEAVGKVEAHVAAVDVNRAFSSCALKPHDYLVCGRAPGLIASSR